MRRAIPVELFVMSKLYGMFSPAKCQGSRKHKNVNSRYGYGSGCLPGRYFPFTTDSFEPAFFELLLNLLCRVHAAVGSDQHVVEPFGG